jgi:multiple sugar transport system substrate-binding protein
MTIWLRGVTWEHERGRDSILAATAVWERDHPDVRIHWRARSLQEFADAPLARLAAEADLLVIDHPHVPLAARDRLLAPLDGVGLDAQLTELAAQSVGCSHDSYAFEGHQYGVAVDAAAQVSVSRPDLLPEPPRDWDDVLALAADGRVLWPAKPIDAFSSLVSVAHAHTGPVDAVSGRFLTADAIRTAMGVLHELASRVPAACLDWNPIQLAEELAVSDRYAFCPLAFGYSNYARDGYRAHRLAYADAPAGPEGFGGALLGGAGLAVSAAGAHLDQARQFAVWACSAPVQTGPYFDAGGQPANSAAWDDPRLDAVTHGFFRSTRATLEQAWVRPRVPGYIAFQDVAAPWVADALRGRIDDAELVRRLDEAARRLLVG